MKTIKPTVILLLCGVLVAACGEPTPNRPATMKITSNSADAPVDENAPLSSLSPSYLRAILETEDEIQQSIAADYPKGTCMVLAAYVSQITKKSKTSDEFMSHNQDKATMLCTELHEECQEKFGEALAKPAEEDQEPRDYECQIQAYAQCDAPFKLVKGCYDESFARYSALVKMTTHKTCKAMANESAALSKPTNTESPQCWQLYDQCPKVAQWISGIGRGLQMISCGGEAPQQGLKEGDNSTGSDSEKQEPSPPGVS